MKKISLLIILVATSLICSRSQAQFTSNWQKSYQFTSASGYSNEARKIAVDATGNVFALADITSNIDSTGQPVPNTQYYVVILKYGSTGNYITRKIVNVNNMNFSGGHDYKGSFGLELDASGNVYVGYTKYNSTTNYDVGVTKYNNSLVAQWSFLYSTGGIETGLELRLRGSNPFVLVKSVSGANTSYSIVKVAANSTSSTPLVTFDANVDVVNSFIVPVGTNIFATGYRLISGVKTAMTASVNSSTGLVKWKNTYDHGSATGDDYASSLVLGLDNDLYISATTYTNVANGNDAVVLRYGITNGNLIRSLLIDRATTDVSSFIANGPTGYVFVSLLHGNGINVCKIATTGTTLTMSNSSYYSPTPISPYSTLTGVSITDMKVAASNNVYICGSITGNSASGVFSASYLGKIGLLGTGLILLNHQDVTGDFANSEQGVSLALDPGHNSILGLKSVWGTYSSHATEQVVITSFNGLPGLKTSGMENADEIINSVSFYPNPASGTINLNTELIVRKIELYDLLGKKVATTELKENSLDISMLRPGFYLVKVITESGVVVKRISVE